MPSRFGAALRHCKPAPHRRIGIAASAHKHRRNAAGHTPENPSVLAVPALCNAPQSHYQSFAMQFSRQLA
jgi:hypothetical protein